MPRSGQRFSIPDDFEQLPKKRAQFFYKEKFQNAFDSGEMIAQYVLRMSCTVHRNPVQQFPARTFPIGFYDCKWSSYEMEVFCNPHPGLVCR